MFSLEHPTFRISVSTALNNESVKGPGGASHVALPQHPYPFIGFAYPRYLTCLSSYYRADASQELTTLLASTYGTWPLRSR